MVRSLAFALVMAAPLARAEGPPILELPVGSVGAVKVLGTEGAKTRLQLIFPGDRVDNPNGGQVPSGETFTKGPVTAKGELVLFDARGVVHRFSSKPFTMRFWCENDGGSQVRPELTVTLELPRALTPQAPLQNLAGFVVVAPKGKVPKLPSLSKPGVTHALVGDLDSDGAPEAGLLTAPDGANNCDGTPKNNLTITLLAGERSDALRCCGP